MKNPTLHDVARLAGVSYATADRVLNRRGNVAEKSVRKVDAAVKQLGYVRNIAAAKLSRNRLQRLAFVLPQRAHPFFGRMHDQLDKALPHLKVARVDVDVIEFPAFDNDALSGALGQLADGQYDGVAFVGQGPEAACDALKALREKGTKVVSLISDGSPSCRDHYIGIDNEKAGRTAARLVGLAHRGVPGQVIVAVGSRDVRDHGDRLAGFRAVVERDFPNLDIVEVIETRDRSGRMRDMLRDSLAARPEVSAIYNTGAGNEGLVEALRLSERSGGLFCIVHELSPAIREALEEGIVHVAIDQRPEIEMTRALAMLQALSDDLPPPPAPDLIPAIYLRDNLPDETS